ncbi:STAS domain-containing protein [Mycolicibacterium poriferae]|jgi:anti-sigma B factor antagonist|uniref:Anti-sigma factor antagonist n=1 Tax=Mycolicibacterium poriferae TaxID=39694 RepID=A0A6N4V9L0_9MYCO|nr:STAS domain-containing protein [Mycolicibacterium poriferae]MCV7263143.1 STAS domain-containing protein [Mycolicibacterium poriferae]QFS90264.1 Anti-sigma-F factor antagonist RsfB [Mycobacterium sp. THAF192]BBX50708.1 anti-sigma factor antagonist [Mycolicibacterium poriferae]
MLEHHGYERSGRCTVSPRQDGAALVLHVAGDLDVLTAPTLMTHLDVALSGGAALLIVDLLDVTFLSSAGISVLVETHRLTEPAGVSLRVVAEGPATSRPMRLMCVDEIIDLYPTLKDARAGRPATAT